MVIETTINISNSNKLLLIETALRNKISVNEMINLLLLKFLKGKFGKYHTFKRIKYQKLCTGDHWKTVHVWFSPDFYEKCLDLRKFHKCSISFILAQAIELYLNETLNSDKCDNYNRHYIFMATLYDNCPIFISTWEFPGEEKAMQILKLYENT